MAAENLAWFVTGHGFGHATRSAAVMDAIHRVRPDCIHHIFSSAPQWVFKESLLHGQYEFHPYTVDVGLAQNGPMQVDVPETIRQLQQFLPFDDNKISGLANELRTLECAAVVSDISPLGAAVGQVSGLPTALIENFTWDWIYQGYHASDYRLKEYGQRLDSYYENLNLHIQTGAAGAPLSLAKQIGFISRRARQSAEQIRQRLGISTDKKMLLATMGGIRGGAINFDQVAALRNCSVVTAGLDYQRNHPENLILLPEYEDYFHPDLVAAADLVVCKTGYSTLAESLVAGTPVLSVSRPEFPESAVLEAVMQSRGHWQSIPEQWMTDDRWLAEVPNLLGRGRAESVLNADEQAAALILELL